ncbi:hypothetical protein E2C01_042323 [Portunus trituberculatus]|uniref:Uncharacterized protein n=1 Tax=Portunus trituberculatus TaxID=210409 RepID=A0A5B7FT54_PORTR|nr:hypothetical protein [Portunus trituberculatus]
MQSLLIHFVQCSIHFFTSSQSEMTTFLDGRPEREPRLSIAFTTSMPSTTLPNTTCFPSSHGQGTVVRKNCEPFVLGPAFAIDKRPGPPC